MNSSYSLEIDGLIARLNKKGIHFDKLPTAIYARKSTKDEAQISIPLQIEHCKKFIEGDERLNLVHVYEDENITGYKIEVRKSFSELLEEVRKGNIKVIVYYILDRETRNNADGSDLDLEFEELDVLQIYTTQYFPKDANGRFLKTIVRADGQRQCEVDSERALDAMKSVANESRFAGGRCNYGYEIVDKKYIVKESESRGVKLMFDLALSGFSIPDIISKLSANGFFTRDQKPFPINTVWNMLRNEKYTGDYIYFKKGARKRKKRVSREEFEEIRNVGGMPAIVSKETFNRVQKILDSKTNKSNPRVQEDYPLRGYIFCGESGKPMHGEVSYGPNKEKYCRYTAPRGDSVKRSISRTIIESATADVIASIVNTIKNKYIDVSTMVPSLKAHLKSELVRLQNKIPTLKKEIIQLSKSVGKLTSDDTVKLVNEEIVRMQEILNSMESRKTSLEQKICSFNSCIKQTLSSTALITGDDIKKDLEVFKKAISLYIEDIKIYEDKIEFNLKDLQ